MSTKINPQYEPVIGLEIHVELSTHSKMFCQCAADWFGKAPNTQVCPVCLGMPGALPVPNKAAIQSVIKIAKALGCHINQKSKFDRKHYFYPDLVKGYQISQYDQPFGEHGQVKVYVKNEQNQFEEKSFRIHRVHMEEDTGKLIHQGDETLIDFNRSGVPLVEIVTEADFHDSNDVKAFLQELQTIIRYLDVSDADMEKGSMRLEPNISVRKTGETGFPPYKVEVKNINSFNFVKKAIDYEVERHIEILETGKYPDQETRGFSEAKSATYSQRSKENAQDYRYFPEPDIPPFELSDAFVRQIFETLPELPYARMQRYINTYHLKAADAFLLTRSIEDAAYFEAVIKVADGKIEAQKLCNLMINKRIPCDISAAEFVQKAAEMSQPQSTDLTVLHQAIQQVIASNSKSVSDYKSGKTNALMFLLGQVMKQLQGKADAQLVKSELEKLLT